VKVKADFPQSSRRDLIIRLMPDGDVSVVLWLFHFDRAQYNGVGGHVRHVKITDNLHHGLPGRAPHMPPGSMRVRIRSDDNCSLRNRNVDIGLVSSLKQSAD